MIYKKQKIINHNIDKLFDMVMDIEKYPQFLPWCSSAKIISQKSPANLTASLQISFKLIKLTYQSDVKYSKQDYIIAANAISGPFKALKNKWNFTKIDNSKTKVDFFIDFQFNSKILEKTIGSLFEIAAKKMIDAFEKRANSL